VSLVQRYDFSPLPAAKIRKTPQGGVRVDAGVARVGVLVYAQADGTTRRELVTPEVLFEPESIESLRDAPLTIGHPAMVDPSNWAQHSVGHLPSARADGKVLAAELVAQRKDAVDGINSRNLAETSCGYTCKLDCTPGTWQGQPYDAIQTERRYNHVGLGPKGWARAGSEASLRLDGSDATASIELDGPLDQEGPQMKFRFDGKEYDTAEAALEVATLRVDAQASDLAKAKAEVDKAQARADSATADLTKVQADLVAANDPKRLDAAINARVALVVDASKVLGTEIKLDGKTAREIRELVIAKAKPSIKLDGRSDDYCEALFDDVVSSGFRADGIQGFQQALTGVERQDASATSDEDADKEDAEYEKKRAGKAKKPLEFSKEK
jgi:uncharacterized protein